MVMSISKIALLTFGMIMLISSVLISNDAFAANHPPNGPVTCQECLEQFLTCETNAGGNTAAYEICLFVFDGCVAQLCQVGGLPLPVDESALNSELAKQYSLWLIPSISAIGIAAFLIKRKL